MMHHGHCHSGRVHPIVCPTQYRCHDSFVQREVPFIHPIVNVNRVNTVNVPRHYFTESTQNVAGQQLFAGRGPGPGPGVMGAQSFPGGPGVMGAQSFPGGPGVMGAQSFPGYGPGFGHGGCGRPC